MNISKIEQHKQSSDSICSVCMKFLPRHHIVTLINDITICNDCEPDLMNAIRTINKSKKTNLKHIVKQIARQKRPMLNRYIYDVPDQLWHETKLFAAEHKKSHREIIILALQKYLHQN